MTGFLFAFGCSQKQDFISKVKAKTTVAKISDKIQEGPEIIPGNTLCEGTPTVPACLVKPIALKPSVATILLTLSQIAAAPAQLIVVNVIRAVSPVEKPKILFAEDSNLHGEDPADVDYVRGLLKGYDVTFLKIRSEGLTPEETAGFDIVWVINPGHPLQNLHTKQTLLAFPGSVVLQGDDMALKNEELTGLKYLNNGTSVLCDTKSYKIDNLLGDNYEVRMEESFLPGIAETETYSLYGNDIDETSATGSVKVLAYAKPAILDCPGTSPRPAITLREK